MRFWLVVLMLAATPAIARTVDYAPLDAAGFVAEAARLKITPISALPVPDRKVTIEAPLADQEVLPLGLLCVVGVTNPVARLAQQLTAELAATSPPAQAVPLTISITQFRSWRRCIELKELNYRCITRVIIGGEARSAEQPPRPLRVSVERDASVGGFCESIAQGTGVITREAALQLVQQALALP